MSFIRDPGDETAGYNEFLQGMAKLERVMADLYIDCSRYVLRSMVAELAKRDGLFMKAMIDEFSMHDEFKEFLKDKYGILAEQTFEVYEADTGLHYKEAAQ